LAHESELQLSPTAEFDGMNQSFEKLGPASRKNILGALNLIFRNHANEDSWRKSVPHELPLNRILDRKSHLERVIFSLTKNRPARATKEQFALVDEIGPRGLNFSK
jgi:hypothetical protein